MELECDLDIDELREEYNNLYLQGWIFFFFFFFVLFGKKKENVVKGKQDLTLFYIFTLHHYR